MSLPIVQIEQIPRSIEAFVTQRNGVAQTPEGGAAMMVLALLAFAEDEALGIQCLTIAVDRGLLQQGDGGYKGWELRVKDVQRIRSQIGRQTFLPRSYIKGATPENGYTLPPPPFELVFYDNPYSGDPESGQYKVFVDCSGAASPRPVTLQRNDRGVWKAYEWSSLLVGVQEPAQPDQDDL